MDASHTKIVKVWCKNCFFCVKKHPIPICIMLLFLLSYMFVPLVYTILIYSSPLVGFSFLGHRVLLGIDRQKKNKKSEQDDLRKKFAKSEQDDKRKKFAKSRRSFKSKYGDRTQLSRRNNKTKTDNINYISDTDFEDNYDDIFSKSLDELLADRTALIKKKATNIGEVNVESVVSRGECSSSYNNYSKYGNVNDDYKDESEGGCWDTSADEGNEQQDKGLRWREDDQKNVMDLGLLETERNKRLEGLMQRRRSRKNLGFQDKEATEDKNNGQISAIKVVKINPFLEIDSCDKNPPGSAPSSLLATRNPFDLPYDPHEEKPDLSGDNFHEEFTAGQHKEPMFCRHQSFSLGAFSHPDATHDNRAMSFYQDLATKRFTLAGLETSTLDGNLIKQDSLISDDIINNDHPKEEGESSERVVGHLHEEDNGSERKTKEIDAYLKASISEGSNLRRNAESFDCGPSTILDDRKADIFFFYGGKKRLGHAPSNSIVSDLQVELSDEETSLKELDLDKERGSWLNLSNLSKSDSEVIVNPDGEEDDTNPLSDIPDHIPNSVVSTDLPSSSTDNGPQSLNSDTVDGLTEVAVRQAHVTSTSPKSVLERGFSTDQASPYHFGNDVQQSDNHT